MSFCFSLAFVILIFLHQPRPERRRWARDKWVDTGQRQTNHKLINCLIKCQADRRQRGNISSNQSVLCCNFASNYGFISPPVECHMLLSLSCRNQLPQTLHSSFASSMMTWPPRWIADNLIFDGAAVNHNITPMSRALCRECNSLAAKSLLIIGHVTWAKTQWRWRMIFVNIRCSVKSKPETWQTTL